MRSLPGAMSEVALLVGVAEAVVHRAVADADEARVPGMAPGRSSQARGSRHW